MKVKELLGMEICVDVHDNVCEKLAVAFEGPIKLTKDGREKFAEVLEYEVDVDVDYGTAIVDVDDIVGVWEDKIKNASQLFYSLAGYCSSEDWDKWFTSAYDMEVE